MRRVSPETETWRNSAFLFSSAEQLLVYVGVLSPDSGVALNAPHPLTG